MDTPPGIRARHRVVSYEVPPDGAEGCSGNADVLMYVRIRASECGVAVHLFLSSSIPSVSTAD